MFVFWGEEGVHSHTNKEKEADQDKTDGKEMIDGAGGHRRSNEEARPVTVEIKMSRLL